MTRTKFHEQRIIATTALAMLGATALAGCDGARWPGTCGSEIVNGDTYRVECGCVRRDGVGDPVTIEYDFCRESTIPPGRTEGILRCNDAVTSGILMGYIRAEDGVVCGPTSAPIVEVETDNCPISVGVACEELGSASGALIDASAQPLHGAANPFATFVGFVDASRSFVEITVRGETARPVVNGEIFVTGGDCPGANCDMRVDGLHLWANPFTLQGAAVDNVQLVDWGSWSGRKLANNSYKFSTADAKLKLSAAINGNKGAMVGEPVGIPGGQFYGPGATLPGGGIAPSGYMTIEGTFSLGEGSARVFLVLPFGTGAPHPEATATYNVCDVASSGNCGWVFDASGSRDFNGGPIAEYRWHDANGQSLGNASSIAPESRVSGDPVVYPIMLTVLDAAGHLATTTIGEPAAAATRTGSHGWVWANLRTSPSYTPALGYQFNSTGATNTVRRSGTGRYEVMFAGLAGRGGNMQVSAYGTNASYCKSSGWRTSGSAIAASVRCYAAGGAAADARFVAMYSREQSRNVTIGTTAYLWANSPTSSNYAPLASYSYNDTAATNRIRRTSTGQYTVELPGVSDANASVQVTAYGANSDRCKTTGWWRRSGSTFVAVRCFAANGGAVDTRFNLSYAARGVPGLASSSRDNAGAYAWANQPTSANYQPSAAYSSNDLGGALNAQRISRGNYRVVVPHSARVLRDTVLVTAHGANASYCKAGGWSRGSTSSSITVRCFNAAGAASDSQFSVAYVTSNSK